MIFRASGSFHLRKGRLKAPWEFCLDYILKRLDILDRYTNFLETNLILYRKFFVQCYSVVRFTLYVYSFHILFNAKK